MSNEKLPIPAPPPAEPPGWLKSVLQHKLLLIILVIILFFSLHFALKGCGRSPEPQLISPPGEKPLAAAPSAPHTPAPSAAPVSPKAPEPAPPGPTALEPPPAVKEVQPPTPAAPPPLLPAPLKPKEKVRGETFTRALIKIIDDQVNKTLFGWRPNTIFFGKLGLTDNVNNLQLGVLDVARRTVIVLNENLTRFAITEAYNPQVNEAMNFLMVSPDKYWFPSASGKYREAIQDLEVYIEDLKRGRSRFFPRVDNLIVLLNNYKDLLGSSYHNLIKDTEADGSPISWYQTDDYFYFSQGIALGMAEMLEAVKEDFQPELQKKNTLKLLEDAIHALHEASHLKPWLVTNGSKDGFIANHRANMSTYIGEAEHLVATMQSVLATN